MFSWFGKVSFVPYSKVQDFAVHLKGGRLMGTVCKNCGCASFPPRADCAECMSGEFEFKEWSGKGTIYTLTRIDAAPTGFEDEVPYTVAVVDLTTLQVRRITCFDHLILRLLKYQNPYTSV